MRAPWSALAGLLQTWCHPGALWGAGSLLTSAPASPNTPPPPTTPALPHMHVPLQGNDISAALAANMRLLFPEVDISQQTGGGVSPGPSSPALPPVVAPGPGASGAAAGSTASGAASSATPSGARGVGPAGHKGEGEGERDGQKEGQGEGQGEGEGEGEWKGREDTEDDAEEGDGGEVAAGAGSADAQAKPAKGLDDVTDVDAVSEGEGDGEAAPAGAGPGAGAGDGAVLATPTAPRSQGVSLSDSKDVSGAPKEEVCLEAGARLVCTPWTMGVAPPPPPPAIPRRFVVIVVVLFCNWHFSLCSGLGPACVSVTCARRPTWRFQPTGSTWK
jgi:hypothetical protein